MNRQALFSLKNNNKEKKKQTVYCYDISWHFKDEESCVYCTSRDVYTSTSIKNVYQDRRQ